MAAIAMFTLHACECARTARSKPAARHPCVVPPTPCTLQRRGFRPVGLACSMARSSPRLTDHLVPVLCTGSTQPPA